MQINFCPPWLFSAAAPAATDLALFHIYLPWSWGFCCKRALESWPNSFPQCSPTLFDVCPISKLPGTKQKHNNNKTVLNKYTKKNSVKEEDGAKLAKRFHVSCLKQKSQTKLTRIYHCDRLHYAVFNNLIEFLKSAQRAFPGEWWNVNVNSCGLSMFIISTEAREGQTEPKKSSEMFSVWQPPWVFLCPVFFWTKS